MSHTVGSRPSQTTAARLLADTLYELTRGTTLTNQAHNELGSLLAALTATETYLSSLDAGCVHLAVLNKRVRSCHGVLLELQTLQSQPDMVGAQSQVSEIRARLSSVTSALDEVNANLMISCQREIERAVSCLADDIVAGKQEISLVTDVLNCSTSEKEEAWTRLQKALAAAGIAPQLSSENHSLIMSTLQKFNEVDALSIAEEQTAPTDRVSAMEPTPVQSKPRENLDDEDWLADEPIGLPFLPLPPKGLSFSDRPRSYQELPPKSVSSSIRPRSYPEQVQPYPEKEALLEGNLPIPIPTEIKDSTDTKESFPIPLMIEIQDSTDTQKQALPTQPSENFPIPVLTEQQEEYRDANLPIPISLPPSPSPSPIPPKPDLTPFKVPPTPKQPHRLTRLLWDLTNSKEPFITSIITGNHPQVQSHLLKGASPNTQNTTSQTPLMAAVSFNHESITRLLLAHGADPNTQSLSGETALSAAASRGYDRLVRTLLASGADPNAGQNTGKTALALAAAYGQDRIVELLLGCGADVDAVGGKGETAMGLEWMLGGLGRAQTPLWKAVMVGEIGMVRLLLVWGADPFVKVGRESVMEYARRLRRGEVVKLFAEFGFYPLGRFQYC
ncbi:uncharacterized protein N7515_009257 [Penicillium bovifimosum]|uniref:Uncharacterized protein n=1 Tax=Penicillium bovifimosum TaxID=126998 RepID=A0A9W9KUC4_9EURO|nr:uncharacterized protein N7515_009257 [Penicillium bovifimosum]KAJ5121296.1 hypothetical protein N7515_009257 [Penicillium bovifimosum]